ncbi:patatin-like phospholipase family protein [Paraflavitalea pollutisoli]|uniref:patatin-like phospholipase family protein n=1 Tax=Paraflavitalea pollutisoli TaxID=3034143 RepID=UPI0023EB6E4B|nr:patatin-like phospholipase family protein [Paraflavitalea sp. H1-2-19X]
MDKFATRFEKDADYGVVFSGGGAFGAWEVGAYAAIREWHGKDPVVVSGASAGALNAAAIFAGKDVNALKKIWIGLKNRAVYKKKFGLIIKLYFFVVLLPILLLLKAIRIPALKWSIRFLNNSISVLNNVPLRKKIEEVLAKAEDQLKKPPMNLAVTLSDIAGVAPVRVAYYCAMDSQFSPGNSSTKKWMQIADKGNLVDALMCTSAIPMAFPPQIVAPFTEPMVDGGVLRNDPLYPMLEPKFGTSNIYMVMASVVENGSANGVIDILESMMNSFLSVSFHSQLDLLDILNIGSAPEDGEPIYNVCIIRPEKNLGISFNTTILSFGGKKAIALIDDGYKQAKKMF